MNSSESTPTRATFKGHGRPTFGLYYGAGRLPGQGIEVIISADKGGVRVTYQGGRTEWIGGVAGKFWFARMAADEQAAHEENDAMDAAWLAENAVKLGPAKTGPEIQIDMRRAQDIRLRLADVYAEAMKKSGSEQCEARGKHVVGAGHVHAECPAIKATHEDRLNAAIALSAVAPVETVPVRPSNQDKIDNFPARLADVVPPRRVGRTCDVLHLKSGDRVVTRDGVTRAVRNSNHDETSSNGMVFTRVLVTFVDGYSISVPHSWFLPWADQDADLIQEALTRLETLAEEQSAPRPPAPVFDFRNYPAAEGYPVTEGHARYCRENGHSTHKIDGVDTGLCPRCGEVTIPAPVAPYVAYVVVPGGPISEEILSIVESVSGRSISGHPEADTFNDVRLSFTADHLNRLALRGAYDFLDGNLWINGLDFPVVTIESPEGAQEAPEAPAATPAPGSAVRAVLEALTAATDVVYFRAMFDREERVIFWWVKSDDRAHTYGPPAKRAHLTFSGDGSTITNYIPGGITGVGPVPMTQVLGDLADRVTAARRDATVGTLARQTGLTSKRVDDLLSRVDRQGWTDQDHSDWTLIQNASLAEVSGSTGEPKCECGNMFQMCHPDA